MNKSLCIKLMPVLLIVLLASCKKEDAPRDLIPISAEHYGDSDTKMYISGRDSFWDAGDCFVWSDGTESTVEIHNGQYYIAGESAFFNGKTAVFPASIVEGSTVTLPELYRYEEDNSGQQKIALPMATYYSGDGHIFFRHISAGLYFTITNNTGTTLYLDRITVENASQYLSGSFSVSAYGSSQQEAESHPALTLTNGSTSVAMRFGESVTIPALGSKTVLLPLAAYSTPAANTVTVNAHSESDYYTFQKTQAGSTISSIACGEVGYASIALSASGDGMTSGTLPFGYPGDGTESNPYVIRTASDYTCMVSNINDNLYASRSAYYEFCNDIDMNGIDIYPMSTFSGVIEGNNHTLSNFTIQKQYDSEPLGLISNGGCTIRNFRLDNVSLEANVMNTGTLIGFNNGSGSVLQNCQIGSITVLNQVAGCFGGFVGMSQCKLTMENCKLTNGFSVSAPQYSTYIGGLVGQHTSGGATSGTIDFVCRNCEIRGDISIEGSVSGFGGLVGYIGERRNNIVTICDNTVAPSSFYCAHHSILDLGGLIGVLELSSQIAKTINNNIVTGLFRIIKSSASQTLRFGKILARCDGSGNVNHSGNNIGSMSFEIRYSGGDDAEGYNNNQYVIDGNDN